MCVWLVGLFVRLVGMVLEEAGSFLFGIFILGIFCLGWVFFV